MTITMLTATINLIRIKNFPDCKVVGYNHYNYGSQLHTGSWVDSLGLNLYASGHDYYSW